MLPDLAFRITAQGATASAFGQTRAQIDQMRGSMTQFRRETGLARSLLAGFAGGLIAGGAFEAINRLPALFADTVKGASRLVDQSKQFGIGVERLQELQYAAEKSEVSFETLGASLEIFNSNIGKALAGKGGDFAEILDQYNIKLRDQAGNQRSVNDIMLDYADVVRRVEGESNKQLLTEIAFGKANRDMMLLLDEGRQGIERLAEARRTLGPITSDEDARRLKEIDESWEDLSRKIGLGIKGDIVLTVKKSGIGAVLNDPSDVDAWGYFLFGDFWKMFGQANLFLTGRSGGGGIPAGMDFSGASKRGPVPGGMDFAGASKASPLAAPVLGGGAGGGKSEADRAKEKIDAVIASLTQQAAMLHMTERAQFIYNEQVRAGVDANSEAGQEIAAIAGHLWDEEDALKATIERLDEIRAVARDVLGGFVDDLMQGATMAEALGNALQRLAQKLIDSGLDSLIDGLLGATGSASGGLFGGLISLLFGGGKAVGGPLDPGKWYIAGEHGPEPIWGGGPGAFAAGYGPASGAPKGGTGAPSVIRLEIDEGPMFRPTIKQVSGEVSVQVSQAVVAQNNRAMERRQATAG